MATGQLLLEVWIPFLGGVQEGHDVTKVEIPPRRSIVIPELQTLCVNILLATISLGLWYAVPNPNFHLVTAPSEAVYTDVFYSY